MAGDVQSSFKKSLYDHSVSLPQTWTLINAFLRNEWLVHPLCSVLVAGKIKNVFPTCTLLSAKWLNVVFALNQNKHDKEPTLHWLNRHTFTQHTVLIIIVKVWWENPCLCTSIKPTNRQKNCSQVCFCKATDKLKLNMSLCLNFPFVWVELYMSPQCA